MEIRRLNAKDRANAWKISAFCFHIRTARAEEEMAKAETSTDEDWGAFAEDGTLEARIINNHYEFYLDGTPVTGGGIGAVSTLPEYRNTGAIRRIFAELLPEARKRGEVLSALYPFNHEFYRKQGYEVVPWRNTYEFAPEVLSGYRFSGQAIPYESGTSAEEYLSLYDNFAKKYNMSIRRDTDRMLEHLKTEKPFEERKFSWILKEDGKAIACLTVTDLYHDPAAIMQVNECFWADRRGFNAILGFLGRFTADYGLIRLNLPVGIDLLKLIRSPKAYDIRKTEGYSFMVRVMNTEAVLNTIRKPADCDFTVRVTDDLLPENSGTWHVTASGAGPAPNAEPDLTADIRALAQMAVGAANMDEILLRPDVELHAHEEMLRRVFVEKPMSCWEAF